MRVPLPRPPGPLVRAAALLALAAAAGAAALAAEAPERPAPDAPLVATPVAAFSGVGAATAVARSAQGALAAGTGRGLWWSEAGEPAVRIASGVAVADLAFDAAGALLAATDRGVILRRADGVQRRAVPGPGDARAVLRVARGAGEWLAGTAAGVFHSRDGERWSALDGAMPSGPVGALAWRDADARHGELWVVSEAALSLARIDHGVEPWVVRGVRSHVLPAGETAVVDVASLPDGGPLVALGSRSLAVWRGDAFQVERPALPPGVRLLRLASGGGRLWLATDAGLLVADAPADAGLRVADAPTDAGLRVADAPTDALGPAAALAGPWRRAPAPLAATAVAALAVASPAQPATALLVASARGVYAIGAPASGAALATSAAAAEPPVLAVQRAALRYVALEPERFQALRRGLAERGYWPKLELSGRYGGARSWGRDLDETFSSGSVHRLFDRDEGHARDFDVTLKLGWELGDVAYSPESVDLSREHRAVVQLRDEVLDEITQLYFERRRVLAQLAAPDAAADAAAAVRLRIRAEELASGLDAWTGGWWSRALAQPSPASSPGPATESHP